MKLHLPKALLSAVIAAGLLGGAQAADFEGSFSWGSDTSPSFTFDDTDNAPVTITGSNQEDPTKLTSDKVYKNTSVHTGTYTPDVNIGNNPANSWTLSFNIEIKDSYKNDTDLADFRITGLVLEAFLFNSSGSLQNDQLARPVYFTLASGDASEKITADLAGDKADADYTLDLPVALSQSSESYTSYTLKCQSAQSGTTNGTYVGLEGMKVTVASVIKDTANVTWANLSSATSWSGTSWKTQAGSLGELAENWNAAATFTAAGANDTHTVNIDTAAKATKLSVTQGRYIFEDEGGTLTVSDGISITEGATATIKTDTTLAGEVANAGNLSFLGKLSVDAETEATLGGTGTTTISSTIENEGKLSLTGNVIMGGIAADFDIKTEGSATYVIDANSSDATNTEGNGFVCTSGREYWLAMGGTNEVSTGITIADAENNTFALHASTATGDTGIYFSTGNNYVDTSKFYVKSGDVSVIGTGAENATGAALYVVDGGTMKIEAGTIKTSDIAYASGGMVLATGAKLQTADGDISTFVKNTTGDGTIEIGNGVTNLISGNDTYDYSGKISVKSGGKLNLNQGNNDENSMDSISLDKATIEMDGGRIRYFGGDATIGTINVNSDSTLEAHATWHNPTEGVVTINNVKVSTGALTIEGQYESSITIKKLTLNNTITLNANSADSGAKANVAIESLSGDGMLQLLQGHYTLTAGTHTIDRVDASKGGNNTGTLTLAAGAHLTVSTSMWVGLASKTAGIKLGKGASLTRGEVKFTGNTDSDSSISRVVDGAHGDAYIISNASYVVKNAAVEVATSADGATIYNRLESVALSNTGTGVLTAGNSNNNLTELQALTGDINLAWYNGQQKQGTISNLNIAAGRTVGAYTGEAVSTNEATMVVSSLTAGSGAKLNANLILTTGASLTLDGALAMGSTLTLGTALTLDETTLQAIMGLSAGEKHALFTGVDELTLNGKTYTMGEHILDSTTGPDLGTYFVLADVGTPAELSDTTAASGYYLGYTADGMVYAGKVIPEPTTATLSLLALAALAARRRRK